MTTRTIKKSVSTIPDTTEIFIQQEALHQQEINQLRLSYNKIIDKLKEDNNDLKKSNDLLVKKVSELVVKLSDYS